MFLFNPSYCSPGTVRRFGSHRFACHQTASDLLVHDWQPTKSMKAVPKFKKRLSREFRAMAVTNRPVEKAAIRLQAKKPFEPESHLVGGDSGEGALVYEHAHPQQRSVHSLLGYFCSLRLIMGTYAHCGSHKVQSKVDPTRRWSSFRGK